MEDGERLFTRPFVLCGLATFTHGVTYSLFLHFTGFVKDLGAGETQAGVLFSLTALSAVAAGPAIGRLMDKKGRRGVILAGNALNVAVVGLYLFIDSLKPLLYAVRLLHGLSEAMLYAALFTYAADQVPRSRTGEGLALFGTAGMLAISAGTVLGDVAIAYGGYTALFRTALGGAVAAFLMALPLPESHRVSEIEDGGPRRWLATLLQRDLVPIWLVTWAFFFAMGGVFTFMKTFLMETELTRLGAFFTVYVLTAITLRVFLGKMLDRVGLERVVGPALVAYASGLFLIGSAHAVWQVAAAAFLCGLGHGYGFPVLLGLVSHRARPAEKGSAMAIYTTIDEGALLVAAPILGFLIEHTSYAIMWRSAGGFLVGAAVLFFLSESLTRRRQRARCPQRVRAARIPATDAVCQHEDLTG